MTHSGPVADAMNRFADTLSRGLVDHGFRRRGRWLYRHRGEAVDVINIQGARRNRQARMFPDSDVAYAYVNMFVHFPVTEAETGQSVLDRAKTSRWRRRLDPVDDVADLVTHGPAWKFTTFTAAETAQQCLARFTASGDAWMRAQDPRVWP